MTSVLMFSNNTVTTTTTTTNKSEFNNNHTVKNFRARNKKSDPYTTAFLTLYNEVESEVDWGTNSIGYKAYTIFVFLCLFMLLIGAILSQIKSILSIKFFGLSNAINNNSNIILEEFKNGFPTNKSDSNGQSQNGKIL